MVQPNYTWGRNSREDELFLKRLDEYDERKRRRFRTQLFCSSLLGGCLGSIMGAIGSGNWIFANLIGLGLTVAVVTTALVVFFAGHWDRP